MPCVYTLESLSEELDEVVREVEEPSHSCFNWILILKMYLLLSFEAFLPANVVFPGIFSVVGGRRWEIQTLYKRILQYQNVSSPNSGNRTDFLNEKYVL